MLEPVQRPLPHRPFAGYACATAAVAAATAAGWLLYHGPRLPDGARRPLLANTNVLMLYLLAVLWVATRHATGPAVLASLLGVAAFDFCFVPPYLAFTVHDRQDLVTFAVMLVTALVIGTLTLRVRRQSAAARAAWARAEAESLRNTLLSGVSHELRTPLAAIAGAAGALSDTGETLPPEARAEMLLTIADEAERMEQLVNNLLDMTRLESGGLALRKEWQPLQEVVGAALHALARRLGAREVTTDVSADLPPVNVDAMAMVQVLVNLVDNAVRYTPERSPIQIAARRLGAAVVLEVSDRGPGLPPGMEERVFEKFFRANPVARARGAGLGLAIARGIVEAHGGTVSATNRRGGGATFGVMLPAGRASPAAEPARDAAPPGRPAAVRGTAC